MILQVSSTYHHRIADITSRNHHLVQQGSAKKSTNFQVICSRPRQVIAARTRPEPSVCVTMCVCMRACTRFCVHLSVCSPTTVPVRQDQFEPGKTLTVKCTVKLLLEKVHAAMLQTWHSGMDIVSILISAALGMESGRPFWLSRTTPQST